MAEGGIYDQLGGGFARYSVDQYWMIPHFEKMLYDNGQLLRVYANAAVATGDDAVPPRRRAKPPTGSCATCRRRAAASGRRSMRTPKATKASSTSGTRTEVRALAAER